MNIAKFSVKNSVFINILMMAILIIGMFIYNSLPRELLSDISLNWVMVTTVYPGAGAEDVERNVTKHLEDALDNIDNIKEIKSNSKESFSIIFIKFDDNLSKDVFLRLQEDVRTEISTVNLPDGCEDAHPEEFSTSDFYPVISAVISGDIGENKLNEITEELEDLFLEIPDISKVEIIGDKEKEVTIEIDRYQTESMGISLQDIAMAVSYSNINILGGTFKTKHSNYTIRTVGEAKRIDKIGQIIVKSYPNGRQVKLIEIATISPGYKIARNRNFYLNQKPSTTMKFQKRISGNTIKLADKVKEILKKYKNDKAVANFEYSIFQDTSIKIKKSISNLLKNAGVGFLLVVVILWIFIGLRNSVLTAMGIPIAFATTFIFMRYTGESLNGNSLFALVMVLGMIVDHAIVIVENSYRHMQMGKDKVNATIDGTAEVIGPITSATLTTIACFLPLLLLPGIMGKFMRAIPLVVSFALLASMFEATVILPSHFAEWAKLQKENASGFFEKLQHAYRNLLISFYNRKILTLMIVGLLFLLSIKGIMSIEKNLFNDDDMSHFMVDIYMPAATQLDKTDAMLKIYEEKLLPLIGKGEVKALLSTSGMCMTDAEWISEENVAQITVDLTEDTERSRSVSEIMEECRALLIPIAGPDRLVLRKINTGPPVEKPINIKVYGDDFDELQVISKKLKNKLQQYNTIYDINNSLDNFKNELKVIVDEEKASFFSLSVAEIGMNIRRAIEGSKAGIFRNGKEEIDILIKYSEASLNTLDDVRNMRFKNRRGVMVPFSSFAKIEEVNALVNIEHLNKKRYFAIRAEASSKKNIASINKEIIAYYENEILPLFPNTRIESGGEFEEFNNIFKDLVPLFLFGVFLMYIILGYQFKSYIQPFIILFTVPFAFMGVVLYLAVSGEPFSFIVMYAVVSLAGIAVNDAIVLISFINDIKLGTSTSVKKLSVAGSVVEAGVLRLRPILLTTLTTISGLLPMGLGLSGKSNVWGPLANTIIFGLLVATFMTLFIIPLIYGLLSDIKNRKLSRYEV